MSKEEYNIMSGQIKELTKSMIEYYRNTNMDNRHSETIVQWTEIYHRMEKIKNDL